MKMSMENSITAKIYGEILAEGMSLAGCDFEDMIESRSLDKLKEINKIISSKEKDWVKLEQVGKVLKD